MAATGLLGMDERLVLGRLRLSLALRGGSVVGVALPFRSERPFPLDNCGNTAGDNCRIGREPVTTGAPDNQHTSTAFTLGERAIETGPLPRSRHLGCDQVASEANPLGGKGNSLVEDVIDRGINP
jgi:hypothetical protein